MNKYLAKSHPVQTIQEHTNDLLKNFELLKKLYGNKIKINWELLRYACICHDLGKMNLKFQRKIEFREFNDKEIPHGILSLAFINYEFLEEEDYSEEEIKILFQAIAYHHNRELNYTKEELLEEIKLLKKEFEDFKYKEIENIVKLQNDIEPDFFTKNERTREDSSFFIPFVLLKGLLNRIDYSASGNILVEVENNFLNESLDKLNYKWNELQIFMKENSDKNIVAVAQTGMGKTEAGLLWIGDNKGFFTLPLKTAINEIYKRITKGIVNDSIKNSRKVGLLHSDTYSKYIENKEDETDNIQEYYNKTKQLSLPLTICTLDQIFDFVFRYKDFEPKLATLSYSKVVIDEVQMYSPDLLAYLILGLDYINQVGGKFAILTATLPSVILDFMKQVGLRQNIDFITPSKAFINEDIRHSLKIENSQIDSDLIISKFDNNRILVVCNTVKKAQELYKEIMEKEKDKFNTKNLKMLHSKFIKRHRRKKEKEIMEAGKIKYGKSEIWIGTQVVEASLDIDFDLLFTELSDINGLFQRLGRCYRKRIWDKENDYNCYIFNGGEELCSGVKYVVDEEIFDLSKKSLSTIDGKITEQEKIKIINNLYTTENLWNTKYYKAIKDNIDYMKMVEAYEFTKSEVKERFRNIQNVTIIPKPIYDKFKWRIEVLEKEINRELREDEDRDKRREQRVRLIYKLKDFTVDVRLAEVKVNNLYKKIKVGKYEEIIVLDCEYSYEEGVTIKKEKANSVTNEFDSRYV